MHVFMPYSDPLRDIAAWFVQLWAESLGKIEAERRTSMWDRRRSPRSAPPTSTARFSCSWKARATRPSRSSPSSRSVRTCEIPRLHGDIPELAYLGGHTLGELLDIEQRATAGALARRGRPNMTLTLDRSTRAMSARCIMFLELATAYAGALYGVNAFDQPGVELGKQFTYAMLGRRGCDAARREWDVCFRKASDPEAVV